MLVSGDEIGNLSFWEAATGRLIASHPSPPHPSRILFNEEGRFLAVGGETGGLAVWNLAEWKLYRSSAQLLRGTALLAFVPESLALVTGNGFIDLERNEYVRRHDRGERPIAATPDAARVLWDRKVGNFYSDEVIVELHENGEPAAAGFSADGRRIATFTAVATEPPRFRLTVWDATTGQSLWSNDSLDVESADNGFAFTHDGRYLSYPVGNGTVHIVRISLPE
jgi:WD40 repeat protein